MAAMTLSRRFLLAFVLALGYGSLGSMAADYKLVWSDEFDGAAGSRPNPSKWKLETGNGQGGWGNGEKEYYDPSNAALDGKGHLVITAKQIKPIDPSKKCVGGPCRYSSARMNTAGHFEFTHGKVDFSVQLPKGGNGIWPALWLLGNNVGKVGWPDCGEIDVLEWRGSTPSVANSALHGPGFGGGNRMDARFDNKSPLSDRFHLFSVEWEPKQIKYLVDGKTFATHKASGLTKKEKWVFDDHRFFIVMNMAVGGGFDGDPNGSTQFPQKMIVDYVKVYQKK